MPVQIMKPNNEVSNKNSLANRIKNKVTDITSDVMSYPARRSAQVAQAKANKDVSDIKMVRKAKGSEPIPNDYRSPLFRARANVSNLKSQQLEALNK